VRDVDAVQDGLELGRAARTRTRHLIPSMSCRFVHADGRPDRVGVLATANRQQRFQPRSLLIGQVKPPRHRWGGHDVSDVQVFLGR
jgi:hypothetical protein